MGLIRMHKSVSKGPKVLTFRKVFQNIPKDPKFLGGGGIRKSPEPPVPAKPNVLYSRERFVDMVCWTVG
jgi:hypothetical protein